MYDFKLNVIVMPNRKFMFAMMCIGFQMKMKKNKIVKYSLRKKNRN